MYCYHQYILFSFTPQSLETTRNGKGLKAKVNAIAESHDSARTVQMRMNEDLGLIHSVGVMLGRVTKGYTVTAAEWCGRGQQGKH